MDNQHAPANTNVDLAASIDEIITAAASNEILLGHLISRMRSAGLAKVLSIFTGEKRIWTFGEPEDPVRLLFVDSETTGTEYGTDKIIEYGGVQVLCDRKTGQVFRIEDTYNALQDPGIPIPPKATAVNGITDEMVKGQAIDKKRVEAQIAAVDFV